MSSTPLAHCREHYDVVIVGAGIVGAGLFRDLALHGLKVLLIDKKDFSSQTSQSSSKMLHGGIRYLENWDFHLVWEALHEKNLWLKLTPHLCYEQAFYLPVYQDSLRPLWMIKAGLMLYDALSSYQNTPHQVVNAAQALQDIPGLRKDGLKGAGIYYDAIVDDAKLTLEVIYDALEERGNQALNYVELADYKHGQEKNLHLLRDTLTGATKEVSATHTVFATGPFTDKLLAQFKELNWRARLVPSKGSHLWIRRDALALEHPLLLTPNDGRVIFVIPQKMGVLVGTTETGVTEDFFDMHATQDEIEYLLANVAEFFPNNDLDRQDILSTFAGVRPLVKEEGSRDLGKTAREHKVFQPFANTYAIVGGKYTTFRVMVQDVARQITESRGLPYSSKKTIRPLRRPSIVAPFRQQTISLELAREVIRSELVRTTDDLMIRRLGIPSPKHWQGPLDYQNFVNQSSQMICELQNYQR